MGIFKRRKDDEAFKIQLEREALEQMNRTNDENEFILPLELQGEDSVWNIHGSAKAPHTITAEELNGEPEKRPVQQATTEAAGEVENISMKQEETSISGSDFLFKRMSETRNQATKQVLQPNTTNIVEAQENESKVSSVTNAKSEQLAQPQVKTTSQNDTPDINALIRSLHEELNQTKSHLAKQTQSIQEKSSENNIPLKDTATTEKSSIKIQPEAPKKEEIEPEVEDIPVTPTIPEAVDPITAKRTEERRTSLLARCNAYLTDDEFGAAKIDTEKYKLESVESILEGFEARASKRAKQNLNLKTGSNTVQIPTVTPTTPPVNANPVHKATTVTNPTQDIPKTTTSVLDENNQSTPEQTAKPKIPQEEQPAEVKRYFSAPVIPKAKEPTVPDLSETKVLTDISSSSKEKNDTSDATTVFKSVASNEQPKPKQETVPPTKEDAYPNDYRNVSDRERIIKELSQSRSKLSAKVWLNLLLLIPAVLMLTPVSDVLKNISEPLFYAIELLLSLFAIIVNFNSIKSIGSLFSSNADVELPSALAAIAVVLQSIVRFALSQSVTGFSAALLLSLLFGVMAKRGFYTRALRNFDLIANSSDKQAVAIVKSQSATKEMVGNSIQGSALVCCGVATTNLKNFLKYTYSLDSSAPKIKPIAIIGLIVGLLLGIVSGVISGNITTGFSVFAATLCAIATPATLWIANLPLKMAADRLRIYNSMLTGHRAADEFDLCNGIAVGCNDLFPEGTIRLVDMKLLSPNPIDQSMLDAAALSEAIGSPLAGIFKQVSTANSYHNHKPKVDTIAYEEKMGISGWVNDRRVFVGNRVLMEAHGFSNLPPVELDKKIMRKGYFPVYLVSDNVPCALLVVKYSPDEEIAYEMRRLCNTGTTVFVHNCDPNISDQMLCDYFGLYPETVSVMSKRGSDQYQELTKYRREIGAGAACRGPVSGLFATLTAGIKVKHLTSVMTTIYIVCSILCLLAIGVSIFTPLFAYLNTISVLVYQLLSTLFICLPPLLKRP